MTFSLTIFTPTFNRAHTLPRLYKSLKESSSHKFEWLIVDDGSTDNTKAYIDSIIQDSPFPIRYIFQKNSGKHAAINTGSLHSNKEWFFIVDSDDLITDDAIETIQNSVSYESVQKSAGVCFRKGYFDGSPIGTIFHDNNPLNLSPLEAGQIFKGDLAYIFQTYFLKQNPFPIISAECFFPELYVWNKIADNAPIIFYPQKIIYLAEYLPDGYSYNFKKNLKKNPLSFLIFYADQDRRSKDFIIKLKSKIRVFQCFIRLLLR